MAYGRKKIAKKSLGELDHPARFAFEFKIGDTIEFKNVVKFSNDNYNNVKKYYCDSNGIPRELIIHGSTLLKENKGTVVNHFDKYIIVNFKNPNGVHGANKKFETQLGFLPEDLELIKSVEKTFKISYTRSNKTKVEEITASTKEEAFSKIKYDHINYVMEHA